MLWNAHNTARRLYSKYEKQIFLALAFFTFVKAYTRENGFASGTSDAKPFFTRNSVSCEALLPAAEPARFRRERTGAAALAKHFFGDGASMCFVQCMYSCAGQRACVVCRRSAWNVMAFIWFECLLAVYFSGASVLRCIHFFVRHRLVFAVG